MVDSGKILIVDRNSESRAKLTEVLATVGFSIVEAENGKTAIEILHEQNPVMVIVGLVADREGLQLGKKIRKLSTQHFIPILQVSDQTMSNLDHLRSLEGPADGFLVQPVEPMVLLATVRSLFRLKQVNDSLRESEENLVMALNVSHMATWYWDVENNQLRFSPSFNSLFGLPEGFDDWTYRHFLDCIHDGERELLEDNVRQLLAGELKDFSIEFQVTWPDQSLHWLSGRGEMLRNEQGRVSALRGAFIDVQKLKAAELESQSAREAAEKANQAKTQFLANMSHEIRTPISAILGFADLLIDNDSGYDRKELGKRIRNNGDQLLRLIDDVLNLSKFEVGKIPLKKEAFSVTELVSDVLRPMIEIAEKKGIRIQPQFSLKGLAIIYSDPVRVKQVIANLIGNALKFSEQGLVQLRVKYDTVFSIEVEDSGIGISEEEQQQIFKPFGQADPSISRRFGGSGLGLIISKKIAQSLGGDLELKWSKPGKGSCFRVTLDIGKASERIVGRSRIEQNDYSDKGQLEGVRILLVDDSPDNEELIRFYLQRDGAKVEVAHNGFEAVDKAKDSLYDLVLMDVQMPGMDGLEATRRLRARGYKTPIIALTAHVLREEIDRSIAAGCNAHLTKPISRKDLVERIRHQLM
jgi:PAS domain S-box-containing protein